MKENNRVTIGITMGDPSGIGPEIIIKSFQKISVRSGRIIVIGDFWIMQMAYDLLKPDGFSLKKVSDLTQCEFSPSVLNILDLQLIDLKRFRPGIVNADSGAAAFECIRKATQLALAGQIDAIVTAPLNKEALHKAGKNFSGHTEILASLTGKKDYAMLLYDRKLSVIHVSTHISLKDAITGLSVDRIEKVIVMADEVMQRLNGSRPRIAVSGINPHAGENALFGREEIEKIIPAVNNMRKRGINVEGPLPPDTVFLQAVKGRFDIVVAMYHDQGHIPMKLLGFNSAVNITVGLPLIRTSVDHGTAFEIAWQGKADENSMVNAIKVAVRMSK
jgi:4-hydroxythreonine-4-phosphate dehydrogenase